MYTYNSAERTGTLAFKIVVDHSTAMSEIKKEGTFELLRYFAGCKDPIESAIPILPVTEIEEIKIAEKTETKIIPKKEVSNPGDYPEPLRFYFRNAYKFDRDTIGTNLETELTAPAPEKSPNYPNDWYRENPNGYLRGTIPTNSSDTGFTQQINLTKNEQSLVKLEEMVKFLLTADGKRFKIKIVGKTSDAGVNPNNLKLGQKRADTTKDYMFKLLKELEVSVGRIQALELGSQRDFPTETTWENDPLRWSVSTTGEENQNLSQSINPDTGEVTIFQDEGQTDFDEDGNVITSQNGLTPNVTIPSAVDDRVTWISLEYNPEIDDLFTIDNKEQTETNVTQEASSSFNEKEREATENEALVQILAARASRYMAWECSYFEKMKQNDEFVYKNLKEKLKYFHPAFHSMTPEGFNSRLTFLKQCTRQGPNIASNEPSNLAFGKPPICVLRVGDFYHTKIVIDSVNLTFDPLVWDLNPEGIGVQPMICTVDLNFKFIGGSSLGGPISQLQNAVGFNFFANTGLYNPRTIYTSTQDYNKTKPDSSTGLESEIPSGSVNNTEKTKLFGYGAYIRPGEVISEGTTGSEDDIMTPPKPEIEETIKKKQIEDEGIVAKKTDELSQEELDTISQQFDKKVEDRSGAFKSYIKHALNDFSDGKTKNTTFNLCSKEFYNDRIIYVKSNQESITKIKIEFPEGTTKTYDVSETYNKRNPKGISSNTNPKRFSLILWDSKEKETSIIVKGGGGIQTGRYSIVAYASVEGTIAQDGIKKEVEIESPEIEMYVECCDNGATSGLTWELTEIPFSGAC
jgi:outer membrane protein OmpA-like peptidoglycan-associated protein